MEYISSKNEVFSDVKQQIIVEIESSLLRNHTITKIIKLELDDNLKRPRTVIGQGVKIDQEVYRGIIPGLILIY